MIDRDDVLHAAGLLDVSGALRADDQGVLLTRACARTWIEIDHVRPRLDSDRIVSRAGADGGEPAMIKIDAVVLSLAGFDPQVRSVRRTAEVGGIYGCCAGGVARIVVVGVNR